MAPVRMPNCRVQAIDNINDDQPLERLWGEFNDCRRALQNMVAGVMGSGSNAVQSGMEDIDVHDSYPILDREARERIRRQVSATSKLFRAIQGRMSELVPSQMGVLPSHCGLNVRTDPNRPNKGTESDPLSSQAGLNVILDLNIPIHGTEPETVPSQAGVVPPQAGMNAQVDVPKVLYRSLTWDVVAPLFGMPLVQAAKELNVGTTTLKLWCRLHDISRWPYRKLRCIDVLKANIEEFGRECQWEGGKAGIIQKLEREKRAIEDNLDLDMLDYTVALSQQMHHIASKKKKRCN